MKGVGRGILSLLLRSFEYFRIFNKEIFYNKIAYIWSLGIPIVFLIISNYDERTTMTYEAFSQSVFFYWSYIILITAAQEIAMGMLFMRDQNFLKMYTYITGSKFPIVLGRILSQCTFLWVSMAAFTVFSGLFQEQPVTGLLVTSVVVLIPVAIPVYLFATVIATLPVRSTNIGPVLTFLVIFLLSVRVNDTGTVLDYLAYLNPAQVIKISAASIHSVLGGAESIVWLAVLPLAVYLLIGIISCQKMNIISRKGR